ncbi:hypothetical protein FXF50_09070 [Micromonospora sp. AP08]|uniref:DUF6299 family protein n=1 Tax=Micromonospora sp. AP08 TaxID=2604467 RepID=UPI0011DA3277|nr:DUF6299 family protein [Micromonospora sp. AP08]TYB38560.1 hypothetical protein FXF50_09070 [Micromonospora sp. AP08]
MCGLLVAPSAAQAHPAESGSLDLVLNPGAEERSYAVGVDATMLADSSDDRNQIYVQINGSNGDNWSIELGAPYGQELTVGTYTGATRNSFREPGTPGLAFGGNGWGCNTLTGSFVINEITMASPNYLQDLDATFEQYCEGTGEPDTGHIVVHNPPPPPILTLAVTVDATGTVGSDGSVTLSGMVACNRATDIELYGFTAQQIKGITYEGNLYTSFRCEPGVTAPWQGTAVSNGPYRTGPMEVTANAWGYDSFYFRERYGTTTTKVRITRD